MKYSEQNKPLVCMQTNNMCYKNTREQEILGILWHSTAANNPNLKRYVQPFDATNTKEHPDNTYTNAKWIEILGKNPNKNDWNHTDREAGLSFWIGKLANGTVSAVQTMPWNYRCWGCGKGSNGSCNDGWIQFEICEASLNDKSYFEAIYKEACEMTAYLCKKFNLNPKGTVKVNGKDIPVILCHQDSYQLGMGNNHADIYHWFSIYGKDMDDVRNDVAALLCPVDTSSSRKYKIGDAVSVKEGSKWESGKTISSWVFNSKMYVREYKDNDSVVISTQETGAVTGTINESCLTPYEVSAPAQPVPEVVVKPEPQPEPTPIIKSNFSIGDEVSVLEGAIWANGKTISSWVFKSKMYVREITSKGIVISTLQSGAVTGTIEEKYLTAYKNIPEVKEEIKKFVPYSVEVTVNRLNVRTGAGTGYRVSTVIKKGETYRIMEEKDGWGKTNKGWIYLSYTKKV